MTNKGKSKVQRARKGEVPAPVQEGRDPVNGHFLPGNRFWEARSSFGRKPLFETPEQLWAACCEYFQWVEDNPLWEMKLTSYKGKNTQERVPKLRAMTLTGLCMFLDIAMQSWFDYSKKPAFSEVIKAAEGVIRCQKFEGAAADLLNANIIARDLGLANHQYNEAPGDGSASHDVRKLALAVVNLLRLAQGGNQDAPQPMRVIDNEPEDVE